MENKSKFVAVKLRREDAEEIMQTYKDFLHFSSDYNDKKFFNKIIKSFKKSLEYYEKNTRI